MNDGPYIEYNQKDAVISWVKKGEYFEKTVPRSSDFSFNIPGLPQFNLQELNYEIDKDVILTDVEKYVALSDIHGQYAVFEKLLKIHQIIDEKGEWSFGNGHLVIIGDVFDRGPDVMDVLWKIFHLEKQAQKSGGKVHMLLGNHEVMVINDQLGYLHKKYLYTGGISNKKYSEFFSKSTFWGQWLASKNVIKSINNAVFVHGGLSTSILKKKKNFYDFNQIFRTQILHNSVSDISSNELAYLLAFENGPLWYRGLAQPYAFDIPKADKILELTDMDHIIIGHTSMPNIIGLYDNRIILVDSSIKFGRFGELLFYENGKFYRGLFNGTKKELISSERNDEKEALALSLYHQNRPALYIKMDDRFSGLKRLKSEVLLSTYFDTYGLDFSAFVKSKVVSEEKKCDEYILTTSIPEDQLVNFGFTNNAVLTIILPCKEKDNNLWAAQRIGQLAKTVPNKLFKAIRVYLKDWDDNGLDMKGILVLQIED